ncbi:hypothetical protein M9H77_26294 [Catharanthus roseus]|uniref:Uncharacterized protein n=1 Tax=Catharanthus roseus TaxID=4058 RepID=A0ACC0AA89_CATRO|nr:hypothetical protein M9H77_26294 [Catharanthus roseus]
MLALQGYELTLTAQKEEENSYIEHNIAFFSQHSRGSNGRANGQDEVALVPGVKALLLLVARTLSTPAQVPSTEIKNKQTTNTSAKFMSKTVPQALAALNLSNGDPSFYIDSEATSYMTNDAAMIFRNGNKLSIIHTGETGVGKSNLANNTISHSPIRMDTKVALATSAIFTVDDITPTVDTAFPIVSVDSKKDIDVVNYAPAGTSTLSLNTVDTVNDDGITVDTDNAPTVDIGTLSTDVMDIISNGDFTIDTASLFIDLDTLKDPRLVEEMKEKLEALRSNRTWSLVSRPTATNIVGSKWAFRVK